MKTPKSSHIPRSSDSFPKKTPQKAGQNHLPNYIKLKPTTNRFPASREIYYPTRHISGQPNTIEDGILRALTISQ